MLNAANEIAVAAFLEQRLPFTGIPAVIRRAMDAYEAEPRAQHVAGLADVRAIDSWARGFAIRLTTGLQSTT